MLHPAMVPVFDLETGATLHRFPVDARELCATGGFSLTAPVAVVADDAPAVPSDESASETMAGKRKR